MIRPAAASQAVFGISFSVAIILLPACAGTGGSHPAVSRSYTTVVQLEGSQEVPPVRTTAMGKGEVVVLPDRSVSGRIVVSDVAVTAAHIHSGAKGTNGPAIVTLVKTSDTTLSVPKGTKLNAPQYAAYEAGNLYVNIHSAKFPGGEIRAQIAPAK